MLSWTHPSVLSLLVLFRVVLSLLNFLADVSAVNQLISSQQQLRQHLLVLVRSVLVLEVSFIVFTEELAVS